MAAKSWVMIDHARHVHQAHMELGPPDAGGPTRGYAVHKSVLAAGKSAGVDVVEIDNGAFRFMVVPSRGMGLARASLGNVELGWKSPVRGPIHPSLVPWNEPSGLGWLEGFDELLVRCGLANNGAPEHDERGILRWPLHGRIANTPAQYLETRIDGELGEITLIGETSETRFHIVNLRMRSTYSTRVGEPGLHWWTK